ncbi:hypothetical protein CAOG_06346 [Capsaspora owczarzaki ATCC 30864]|uniref:Exocyst complex component Sec3 PIP2-binding N-terminal domain-containing protein n=1 Tax=Capsaspora owczarzaki (strain ATCC 30864) TaxID=595528 RepID=A0A0D2WV28_CAPO3|nr:hypothetical protein CAOG_06346 [Capsaspora owczarzaki ATCC 30864]KJE95963.1 hypothetical protein CAOG_006346 [Capsaspora owczarzaki ATCC 30864]|eukprot:XP_004345095.1 hypothetical protein CAOG_06346 [Capsaspora owczarzaki ATCC 30864]
MDIGARLRREVFAPNERLIAWLRVMKPAKRLDRLSVGLSGKGGRLHKARIAAIAMRDDSVPVLVVVKQKTLKDGSGSGSGSGSGGSGGSGGGPESGKVFSRIKGNKSKRAAAMQAAAAAAAHTSTLGAGTDDDGGDADEDEANNNAALAATGSAAGTAGSAANATRLKKSKEFMLRDLRIIDGRAEGIDAREFSLQFDGTGRLKDKDRDDDAAAAGLGAMHSAASVGSTGSSGTPNSSTIVMTSSGSKTVLKYTAETADERNAFIGVVWRLCKSYLAAKPQLKNVTKQQVSSTAGWDHIGLDNPSTISFLALSPDQAAGAMARRGIGAPGSRKRNGPSASEEGAGDAEGDDAAAVALDLLNDDLMFESAGANADDRELNEQEERDMESFLSAYETAVADAEGFMDKLQHELHGLDSANIHALLSSEMQIDLLVGHFDRAQTELDRLESFIDKYDGVVDKLRQNVEAMEAKHGFVRVQTENYRSIQSRVEGIVDELDVDPSVLSVLETGDLAMAGDLRKAITASARLRRIFDQEGALNGLTNMTAVKQRRKYFAVLRQKFVERLAQFMERMYAQKSFEPVLPSMVAALGIEASRTLQQYQVNQLQLPVAAPSIVSSTGAASAPAPPFAPTASAPMARNHSNRHSNMLMYTPLLKWLRATDSAQFEALTRSYMQVVGRIYKDDGKAVFEQLRHAAQAGAKGAAGKFSFKVHVQTSGGPLLTTTSSTADARDGEEVLIPMMPGSSAKERIRFDQAFDRALALVVPLVLAEQAFVFEFFDLKDKPAQSSAMAGLLSVPEGHSSGNKRLSISDVDASSPLADNSSSTSTGSAGSSPAATSLRAPSKSHKRTGSTASVRSAEETSRMVVDSHHETHPRITSILVETQGWLEGELQSLLDLGNRLEHFNTLIVMVKVDSCLEEHAGKSNFLTALLTRIFQLARREFDKFIDEQKRHIEDAKTTKKAKPGVLPFVLKFTDFVSTMQLLVEGWKKASSVDPAFVAIAEAVFDGIERIASDCKHGDVVRFENYHGIFQQMSLKRVACIEPFRKQAQQEYKHNIDGYVTSILGSPLEKLSKFFEGVQKGIDGGIREDEIGFQVKYSKQELKKIIKEYPGKEVKKGLEHIYQKVQKHLSEEASLLQVVWRSVQEQFLAQYKSFEDLIRRCYPGSQITLEFNISDLLSYFSELSRSQ